jgi:hypothetical protein
VGGTTLLTTIGLDSVLTKGGGTCVFLISMTLVLLGGDITVPGGPLPVLVILRVGLYEDVNDPDLSLGNDSSSSSLDIFPP